MEQPKIDALSHALEDVLTGRLSGSVFELVKVAVGEKASEAAGAAMQAREMAFTKAHAQAQADGAKPAMSPSQRRWQNKGDGCWMEVLSRTRERDLDM